MLDLKYIKENKELVAKNNRSRGIKIDLDALLGLYEDRNANLQELETKRALLNKQSKTKPDAATIKSMKALGEEIKSLEKAVSLQEQKLNEILIQLPNLNSATTPIGKSEQDNEIVKTVGQPPKLSFPALDHVALAEKWDLIDFQKGAAVSGSRFWYLKRELVQLQYALFYWAFEKILAKGFQPMAVPHLVKARAMFGTGFFPAEENEIYKTSEEGEELFLIGTAEVPLVNYHADDTLNLDQPVKYFAFTPAYRHEAGTYGKDTKGILRGHQFDKVEMVVFCKAEQSAQIHEELLAIEEELWQELNIPYRVINFCSADIGAPAAKKYDIEAWLPGQNQYREVTSCSNTTDFQARRLNIKYQDGGKKELAHTLNGTVIALGRALIAIMENYQQTDGTIAIPDVLKKYAPNLGAAIGAK